MKGQINIGQISKELNQLAEGIRVKKMLRRLEHNRPPKYREVVSHPYPLVLLGNLSARAHLLCCIRAHHHDKIHSHHFKTLEDQAAFIGDSWKEFERVALAA